MCNSSAIEMNFPLLLFSSTIKKTQSLITFGGFSVEKKYNIYFTVKNEKGIARPVVMRGWYESPIEAIKAAKRRNATAANIVVTLYIPKEK